jgi:hypothetical protein
MPRISLIAFVAFLLAAPIASASNIVDRNVKNVGLKVNSKGIALVTYKAKGIQRHVIYWGAEGDRHEFFRYDRSGGAVSKKITNWKKLKNVCGPYTGPPLKAVVAACTMKDGTHWALQNWIRIKKNHGGTTGPKELHVSHWRGAPPVLTIKSDWSYPQHFRHLYGTYTYHGRPVQPGKYDRAGRVLDGKGRNLAIESFDSNLGKGWHRVDMFLAHKPRGQWCYTFIWQGKRQGVSNVNRYRASVAGPGVAPDLVNQPFTMVADPFDPVIDRRANDEIRRLSRGALKVTRCLREPL